jgi:hypothetical protein
MTSLQIRSLTQEKSPSSFYTASGYSLLLLTTLSTSTPSLHPQNAAHSANSYPYSLTMISFNCSSRSGTRRTTSSSTLATANLLAKHHRKIVSMAAAAGRGVEVDDSPYPTIMNQDTSRVRQRRPERIVPRRHEECPRECQHPTPLRKDLAYLLGRDPTSFLFIL